MLDHWYDQFGRVGYYLSGRAAEHLGIGDQIAIDRARQFDPFAKLGKQQIAIDVSSVIRASPSSFRVEWIEHHYEDGALAGTSR